MKKKRAFFLLVLVLLFKSSVLANCINDQFEQPLLITSLGQNPDGLMVKVVMEKLGVKFQYLPLAGPAELVGSKTLIISAGISYKGLAAADLKLADEIKRSRALREKAQMENLPVIFVHFGGKARRDDRSNQLIEIVAPQASYLIIYQDSNNDQYFTSLAEEKEIPLQIIEKLYNIRHIFSELLVEQS